MNEQEILEQIQREWKAFMAANDVRQAEIKAMGSASAETTQKVDRINNAITTLQTELDTVKAQGDRLDELENRLNRPGAGSRGQRLSDEQLIVLASWQGMVQGKEVDPEQVDVELAQNYTRAFRDYVRHGDRAEANNLRLLNEMSVGSDADGGYWVTPDMTGRIVTLMYETSPIRELASVQEISTDALEGDLDLDEAGSGGWVGETQTRSGDTGTPQIGQWKIAVHEQYAEPRATQKFLDDARTDPETWLAGKVSDKFARVENAAFVSGDGTSKPRGFLTYPAGTPTAGAWQVIQQVASGHASTLTADGIINLIYSLKSALREGAVFGMQRLTEAAIRKLKDGDNTYLWQPDFSKGAASTILGYPIVELADMPAVAANALPIVFGNLGKAYQVVDRAGIRVLRDPYTTKGRVKFYSTKRTGGGVVNFEAIKLHKISES